MPRGGKAPPLLALPRLDQPPSLIGVVADCVTELHHMFSELGRHALTPPEGFRAD